MTSWRICSKWASSVATSDAATQYRPAIRTWISSSPASPRNAPTNSGFGTCGLRMTSECQRRASSMVGESRRRASCRIRRRSCARLSWSCRLSASQSAIEELANLRLNGTAGWFVLELAVHQLSNNHFSFGRIFLPVPSFGPREGRNGLLEIRIPFTVGPQTCQGRFQVALYFPAPPAHIILDGFVDKLVHGTFQYPA